MGLPALVRCKPPRALRPNDVAENSGQSGGSVDGVDGGVRPIHSVEYAIHYDHRLYLHAAAKGSNQRGVASTGV